MAHEDPLSRLPDEVLRAVFTRLPHVEVARAKRVNQRLNLLLTRHRHRLPRTRVDDLLVERRWTATHTLGKIRRAGETSVKDRRVVVALRKKSKTKEMVWKEDDKDCHEVQALDTILREVELGARLSFDHIAFSEQLADVFDRSWTELSSVRELGFTYCYFALSAERWCRFVEKLKELEKLVLDFGVHNAEILSDKVLSKLPRLRYLSVQPRGRALYLPGVTDATLDAWAASPAPPQEVNLYKSVTNFTLHGILRFIKALVARNNGDDVKFHLDLGVIHSSYQSDAALAGIISLPSFWVEIHNDCRERRIDVIRGNMRISFNLVLQDVTQT